jgi:hypothetical protein
MLRSRIRMNHKIFTNEASYGFEIHAGSGISSGAKITVKIFICAFTSYLFR